MNKIQQTLKQQVEINDWLNNTYGLDDDDCLSASDVAECVEMAVTHFLKKQRQQLMG